MEEQVSFFFGRIQIDYKMQDAEGKLVPGAKYAYDVRSNKVI